MKGVKVLHEYFKVFFSVLPFDKNVVDVMPPDIRLESRFSA
jgi:hypothetical protein